MTEKASATTESSQEEGVGFGNDDLGRLQGILIGDHARKTSERIDTLEKALLGALADLRSEMTSHVKKLTKQLDGEKDTRATAVDNLGQRLREEAKSRASDTKQFQATVDSSIEQLQGSVEATASDARLELEATRRELIKLLEDTAAEERDYATDRRALATLLAQTAAELDPSQYGS